MIAAILRFLHRWWVERIGNRPTAIASVPIRAVGILIALALLYLGCKLHLLLIESALDDAWRRNRSNFATYIPEGTPAYYWLCTIEILKKWESSIFPFEIGMLAAAWVMLELMGVRITAYSIRTRFGFALILLCLVASLDIVSLLQLGFTEHTTWFSVKWNAGGWEWNVLEIAKLPWPALVMTFRPRKWRHALIILSFWSGFVLILWGFISVTYQLCLAGLGLIVLNICSVGRRLFRLPATNILSERKS